MNHKKIYKHRYLLVIWLILAIYVSTLIYIKLPFINISFDHNQTNKGLLSLLKLLIPDFSYELKIYNIQVLIVWGCGILAGPKIGLITALIYIALGLLGLPIFSGGGGLSYIHEVTFGYLISLPLLAYLSGKYFTENKKILAISIPIFITHLMGVLYIIIFKGNYSSIAWHLSYSMIGYDLILSFILYTPLSILSFFLTEMFTIEVPDPKEI